jgi:hypothetical protein
VATSGTNQPHRSQPLVGHSAIIQGEDTRHTSAPMPSVQAMSVNRSSNSTTPTQQPLEISTMMVWETKQARAKFDIASSGHQFQEKFEMGLQRIQFLFSSSSRAQYVADIVAVNKKCLVLDLDGPLESEWLSVRDFMQENRAPEKVHEFQIKIRKG